MLGVLTYLFYLLSKPNIPSSECACRNECRFAALGDRDSYLSLRFERLFPPLNSGSHRPQKSKDFSGTPLKPSLVFYDSFSECACRNECRFAALGDRDSYCVKQIAGAKVHYFF